MRRNVRLYAPLEVVELHPAAHHQEASTWVIAAAPQPRNLWPRQALIWEAATPYMYVRATDDDRVKCGGEDEPDGDAGRRDAKIDTKARILERRLRQLLPQLDTRAEFAWTGSFGQSKHGMPTIGAIPGLPNCYAVLGFGGNGITFSMLAAQLLCTDIRGDQIPMPYYSNFLNETNRRSSRQPLQSSRERLPRDST